MHLFYMLIICTICVPDRSVWVSDSQQPFVEHRDMSPDVLYMREKQSLVIPCRVTHPNVTTTLVKVSAGNLDFHLDLHTHVPLCLSQPHHTEHILCTSSLVPVFFPSRLTCAHNAPSSYFSLSRSFPTLFLSWQPLRCGVCVHLFVFVSGYV